MPFREVAEELSLLGMGVAKVGLELGGGVVNATPLPLALATRGREEDGFGLSVDKPNRERNILFIRRRLIRKMR